MMMMMMMMMMAGRWFGPLTPLITLTLVTQGMALDCFVCSYSPNSNTSRVDGCTEENFSQEYTGFIECALGCEAVSVYTNDGDFESFYRNCASENSVINTCETYGNNAHYRRVCSCDSNYCNAAFRSVRGASLPALLTLVLCILLAT